MTEGLSLSDPAVESFSGNLAWKGDLEEFDPWLKDPDEGQRGSSDP
jgi:hypothetical protein